MNNYAPPLQGLANNMAQYGRYGDSMLVHMNPIEVQGIAALSPTGRLTTNPVTGQQEAFLPFLAPLLGSWLGTAALGGTALGTLGAGALGSGLATWATTGDLKKGILSGITGFGLGKILGAGTDVATGADAAKGGIAASNEAISELIPSAINPADLGTQLVDGATSITGMPPGMQGYLGDEAVGSITGLLGERAGQEALLEGSKQRLADMSFRERLAAPFSGGSESLAAMGKAAMSPGAILPIAVSGAELGRLETEKNLAAQIEREGMFGEADKKLSEEEIARAIRQRIYDYGMPSRGIQPLDPRYSPTAFANSGGLVSLNPMDYQNKRRELARLTGEPVRMRKGGSQYIDNDFRHFDYDNLVSPYDEGKNYGPETATNAYTPTIAASEAQSALRGSQLISAPQMQALYSSGYRPGFGPELQYFREPDRFGNDPFGGDIDPMNPNAPPKLDFSRFYANPGKGVLQPGDIAPTTPTAEQIAAQIESIRKDDFNPYQDSLPSIRSMDQAVKPPIQAPDPIITKSDYRNYVNKYKDLAATYKANPKGRSIEEFGKEHYEKYGANEGRTIGQAVNPPIQAPDPIIPNPVIPNRIAPDPIISNPVVPDPIIPNRIAPNPIVPNRIVPNPIVPNRIVPDPVIPNRIAPDPVVPDRIVPDPVIYNPIVPDPVVTLPTKDIDFDQSPIMQQPMDQMPLKSDYQDEDGDFDNLEYKKDLDEWNKQIRTFFKDDFKFGDVGGLDYRFNSGGLVRMQDMGQVPEMIDPAIAQDVEMQSGIASVDPTMGNIDPATIQLVEQTAMAVLGRVPPEQADAIIQAFIQQFGSEAFQILRQEVLASVEPNAQTEGIIQGQGDGMSDEIQGMIGDQQRVAVSPGEYIVPADVVSGIGNGSSDAGAGELDSMMEEIRQARTGMTEQPPAIDPRRAMPV